MKRVRLTRSQWIPLAVGTACLLVGVVVGLFVPQGGIRGVLTTALVGVLGSDDGGEDPHAGHDHGHDSKDVVLLTELQMENLYLETERVRSTDDTIDLRVPGRVIERPGFSDLTVASTVTGVVTRVHVVPGQAVRPGQRLVELKLTGEALATAQSSLLRERSELEAVDAEIKRLEPLVKQGSVPGKQVIQLEYDRRRIESRIRVRKQELLLYGLKPEQVAAIEKSGELLDSMTVRLPERIVDDMATTPVSSDPEAGKNPDGDWRFTIESLETHPGKSVKPGNPLVKLAHHTELFVEGQAFEHEVSWIEDLEAKDWTVTLEYGIEGHESFLDGLRVLYLDNHVDEESRTFNFYVPLVNSPVLPDRVDASGTVYRTWRYKPGQLVHVLVPQRELRGVFRLPPDAVADEGLESFVFRRGRKRHVVEENEEIVEKWEFKRTPVRVVHRSTTHVYVQPSNELPDGRTIVTNKAHLLLLATKQDSGGGGHAHHGHSH